MKCPACGKKAGKWDVKCTKCGYDLSKLVNGGITPHNTTDASGVFRTISIVFVVITIIFGIMAGVVLKNVGAAFIAWLSGVSVAIAFWGVSKHFENQEELINAQITSNDLLSAINNKLSK